MQQKTKVIIFGVAVLLVLSVPVIALLGRGGWLAFFFNHENPFTYIPETEQAIKETHARGEQIVAALERWKAITGKYPASLDLLVPSELASIPRPVVGNGIWKYTTPGDQSFRLRSWVGPDYESDYWDSGAKDWYMDR